MAIVDAARLNRFLSSPNWTEEQAREAEDILDEWEAQLGDQLATYITPVPWSESAPVLPSGLVATRHPIASVTSVDGVAVDEAHPLPGTWFLPPAPDARLRWKDPSGFPPPAPSFSLMTGWSPIGIPPHVNSIGSITIDYLAGWGNLPALRAALLSKAGVVFLNRHDDSVQVRNLDSSEPPPLPTESWTDADLKPLQIYRNITVWK